MRSALLLMALAMPASAQDTMTGAAFEAFVEGKTLGFRVDNNPMYGTERYMANRRVIWSTIDGRCTTGIWFDSKDQICFRYDDDPTYKCWLYYDAGDQLIAYFERDTSVTHFAEVIDDDALFLCNGLSS